MSKKERIIIYITFIIILILLLKKVLNIKEINYKIKNENITFNIKEKFNKKNYSIQIYVKNKKYNINIYNSLTKKSKVINNIYYFNDNNYECVLPIFSNEVLTDVMCYKNDNNYIYNYNQIIGKDSKLDEYVSGIKLYNKNVYNDNKTYSLKDTIKFFDNDISNTVSITSYKGLYINKMPINLFEKDIYNNKLSAFIDNYYLIANYNESHEFNEFYLVNLNNNEVEKIKSKEFISFDSFIQGIVDKKVYLYDYDNEVQYEINIYNKKITEVSNKDYIKYYTNTKWERLSKSKVKRNTYFDYSTLNNDFTDYDFVKYSQDYYYLLNKNGIKYKLYRIKKDDINIITYIGEVPTLDLNFNNDYFYYKDNNKVYFYSDRTGFKTILEDSEMEFNETIKYYIY